MLSSLLLEAPKFLSIFFLLYLKFIMAYVENMLKLEGGAIGGLVGGTMLVAIMDWLIDLDVSCLKLKLRSVTV